MDKISAVKKEVQLQNWSVMELSRQKSGLSVAAWCEEQQISRSVYYYRLRKVREHMCTQIPVPIAEILPPKSDACKADPTVIISCGNLKIEIGSDAPSDMITAIIGALKC